MSKETVNLYVIKEILSDGSAAFNVRIRTEGDLSALDETHALVLASEIERAIHKHTVDSVFVGFA